MSYKNFDFRDAFQRALRPLVAGVLIAGAGGITYAHYAVRNMRVTVEDTTWNLLRSGEGLGLTKTVYITDKGKLTNTINPIMGKFTRGGVAEQIEVGKTYDMKVQGLITLPLCSIYPNILSATPVTNPPTGTDHAFTSRQGP
jgi:hypothetical protein